MMGARPGVLIRDAIDVTLRTRAEVVTPAANITQLVKPFHTTESRSDACLVVYGAELGRKYDIDGGS